MKEQTITSKYRKLLLGNLVMCCVVPHIALVSVNKLKKSSF